MTESSHIQSANLRATFTGYTSAILSIVAATAVRAILDPVLGNHLPFVTYFIAIMFSAWYSGRWPSWLALILGYLAATYFFVPPRWSLAVAGLPNQIGIGLYFFVGITSIILSDTLRVAQRRAEASADEVHRLNVELEQRVKERTAQIETANERVRRQNAVLDTRNKVFKEALTCESEEDLGKTCLAVAEDLSGSKFGFLGELNEAGLFDTIAISNPGWDACRLPEGQATLVIRGMPVRGIDRSVLREGKSRIVNGIEAIKSHPDHVEVPKGHPPVTAFLGVPLKEGGKTIGMIGLGNREGGYTTAVQEDIEALAVAIVEAFKRKRSEILVRSLNKEMSVANKELEAFSYSVSHDLRAPLRAIDGFSNILMEDYRDRLDDEGRRLLNVVRENTKKMGQLIDDILQFSRMGRKEMSIAEIDMEKLINDVYAEIKASIPERKIQFTVNPLASAYGDFPMLRQVVSNLLLNAVKFTRQKEDAVIEVGMQQPGTGQEAIGDKENIYYVKDNGVGFDMKYADKLFGVFQRLHSMEEFEGTGIGLAIVKRIITRHGGRVWADGKAGEGTVFYFTLPKRQM